jgi:iron complex outermembrane receptor protein
VSDRDNIYAPRYSANFDLTWVKGDFAVRYGIDWRDKTRRVTEAQLRADPDYVDARYIWYREAWEHDVHLSKRVGQDFEFYGGVTNLWDRKPDIGAQSYPISAVGRSFYTGLKAKFF